MSQTISPYARWQDAMFAQHRVVENYKTDLGLSYLGSFIDDMNSKHPPEHQWDRKGLAAIHMKTLYDAEPVWVSNDACQLIDHARHTFEPEPVLASDPFVPCGFALLAEPLVLDDAPVTEKHPLRTPGGKIPIRALSWMAIHDEQIENGCYWISFFVDVRDEIERYGDERWTSLENNPAMSIMPLTVAHIWQWTWGEAPWREPDKLWALEDEDVEAGAIRAKQQTQMVQTLWRLGSQFMPKRQPVQRQLRRQAERKKFRVTEGVTVVKLRRGTDPNHEYNETDRRLTVQFPVRGYWAIRHTRDGPRQRWVMPHMKGPEDAPLQVNKRAWEFTR